MTNVKINRIIMLFLLVFSLTTFLGCKEECLHENITEEITKEVTCTNDGLIVTKCLDCGKILKEERIDCIGHIEGDEVITKKANCTEGGEFVIYCKNCGIELESGLSIALGHKKETYVETEPTCVTDGKKITKCTVCGEKIKTEIIPALGHDDGIWVVKVEATETTEGVLARKCTICNEILETKSIPVNHIHDVVIDERVEPTCGVTGLTEGSHCEICGAVLVKQEEIPALTHNYVVIEEKEATKEEEGYIVYECTNCHDTYTDVVPMKSSYDSSKPTVITITNGQFEITNNNEVTIDGTTILIIHGGEYTFKGELLEGNILINASDDDKVTINLEGFTINCSTTYPIYFENADKAEVSAKSGTQNFVNDKREPEEDGTGGAIYAACDLDIKGKGELTITSTNNNGIATKDDLEIKNLTLDITCINNCLKGNDSLTIESGNLRLVSTLGDGLKTEKTDVSSKGKQRGIITINGGKIQMYVACDGIDASYDVVINDGEIIINTEKYSEYSGDVTVTQKEMIYLRLSSRSNISTNYYYYAQFTMQDNSQIWVKGNYNPQNNYRYFDFEKTKGAVKVRFFAFLYDITSETDYLYASELYALPDEMDVFYVSSASNQMLKGQWTNYTTQNIGPGGKPGMSEGNPDKASYSCKGIKADNEIFINGGIVTIKAHDDAIHANSDVELESGYGKGNVSIIGGVLTLTTDDDGIHADGVLDITGGDITVLKSYEGLEGDTININNATIYLISSDDGINSMTVLNINGGLTYLNANGDGIDSNGNVNMTGGIVLAQGPTNGGNGVLDFDRTFTFSGGLLLAIGCNGMNQKPSATTGNTSTTKNITTNTSSYVTVSVGGKVIVAIKVTKNNQNYCVLAYNNTTYSGAAVNVTSNFTEELVNNAYYVSK